MAASDTLVWFRNDLRIEDNPALQAAVSAGGNVVAVYIHETDAELRQVTGAAHWWLHESLNALAGVLGQHGIEIVVRSGTAMQAVLRTAKEFAVRSVVWNRRYGPAERSIDERIKTTLREQGLAVRSFNAGLLVEPWDIATTQGKPFSVFTPFWKALQGRHIPPPVTTELDASRARTIAVADAGYRTPAWARKLEKYWTIGEAAARDRLATFLDEIEGYEERRDFPGEHATSRLSPHLRFGEIGPRQVWYAAKALAHRRPELSGSVDKFLSEIAWREFNYHQLYHRENIAEVPMQPRFASMRWRNDKHVLERWTAGCTGFPIIDAGMRELWQTGYMHNRVRMLTASLLAKNLLIDWHEGERWFWDCLVDADPANNPANWQWVAGSGLDAAPWFRIFNPQLQGQRFDADGRYVRRWVPEIAALPDEWIHRPHLAPSEVLHRAGIVIGQTYPAPIVDLKASRKRALEALPKK